MISKFITAFFLIASSAMVQAAPQMVANNTPRFIKKAADLGPVDPSSVITATVWLKLHNEAQLDSLVKGQHQKGSPDYHKWITQTSSMPLLGRPRRN